MKFFTVFVALLAAAATTTVVLADDQTNRRLPGKSSKAQGADKGLDNEKSIKLGKSSNVASAAKQAKSQKSHVGISGLGISPAGHSDEIDLVVSNTFSPGCRITTADGSSRPCDTGRIVLTSAEDEPTFTVLSTDEVTGETSGFSLSDGKKFFKVNQKNNRDVDAIDSTDEEFTPPAWACHNDEVAKMTEDKMAKDKNAAQGEIRRLFGHSHDHDHQ